MKKFNILRIVLYMLLILSDIIFFIQFNQLTFVNKMVPIIVDSVLLIILFSSIYLMYKVYVNEIRFRKTSLIISIILNIILLLLNIGTNIFDGTISKITSNDIIYSTTIITLSNSSINSIKDLNNVKIGISGNEFDYENYKIGYDYLKENNKVKNNTFYKYEDYSLALKDLLNGNIDALIISSSYLNLYGDFFENLDTRTKQIMKPLSYSYPNKKNNDKKLEDPFTVLVIGADGSGGATYNADVLILMTINPNTKNVVMVDVVRDTYAFNLGNNMMDKITHSGWYGTDNVVNTVSNLFGIKIDYYVRMNFESVIELVDLVGGVTINVPYRYIVKPYDGRSNYYLNAGTHTLSGIETLWLARTRKEVGSNLFTRGEMQMTIIEQLTKQVNGQLIINNFFKFTDILEKNVVTNIAKNDLYYYIQKYMFIKDDLAFSHNRLLGTDSSYYHTGMGQYLYAYAYDQNSLNELKALLANNLIVK